MTHAVQFERPPANSRAKSLVSRALLRGQLRFAIPVSLELSANTSSARQVKCSPDRTSQAAAGNGIFVVGDRRPKTCLRDETYAQRRKSRPHERKKSRPKMGLSASYRRSPAHPCVKSPGFNPSALTATSGSGPQASTLSFGAIRVAMIAAALAGSPSATKKTERTGGPPSNSSVVTRTT